jgi:hypothetical protein
MLSEIGQTTDQLLNPGARSLSRDSEGPLFLSFVDDPEADGRATPGYQWTGSEGNPVHTGLVLKGVFGLLNTGSGGPAVVSSAKFGYEKGNNDRQNLAKEAARKDGGEFTKVRSGNEIGIGGQLVTVYQYQGKGKPHLVEFKTEESVGIDGEHTSLSFSETGGSLVLNGAVSTGWIFEQELVAKQGESLPNEWALIGYLGGLFADLEKNYITQGVLRKQEGFLGGGVGVVRPLEIQGISPSYFRGGNALDNMSSAIGNNHARLQYLNATVGVILAAIGPASAFVAATDKDDTSSQNPVANLLFSHSQGLDLWTRLTGRYLWKSVAGLQLTVANKLTKLLTGNEKGAGSDDFFANMGIALPLGSSIPLLSYSFSKSWGGDESHQSSDDTPQLFAANSTGTTTSTGSQKGAYISATSGEAYPFLYAPQSGSNSYFSPATSTAQSNVALLGGQATPLQLFTLQPTAIGAINPAKTTGRNALSLYNPGSGLVDGNYTNVPILGVTADGDPKAAAKASFTVQGGSIQASSFQIVSGGSYLELPETQQNSGTYALLLDVYSTGIATPPDPSGNLGNIFADLPLITLESNSTIPPPLQIQTIQRVSSVSVNPADQPANLLYPQYDPTTQAITAPSATQNSLYTYTNVPVQLFSSATSTTAIPLLNPGATSANPANSVTATVTLSGGVIQRVALDQPLLVADGAIGTSTTSLRLILPDAVVSSLPQGSLPPSFAVAPETLGFNNVVADEQFSAQPGLANTGVFLASGLSDALPLTGAMAA